MTYNARHALTLGLSAIAAGLLAGCVAPSTGPREVRADNPSVTYNYRTDQELLQASQNATSYCAQYQSIERTSRITSNSNGTNTAVFDCVKSPTMTVATTATPVPVQPANDLHLPHRPRTA